MISPHNGAIDIELRPRFLWKAVPNAKGYELEISLDGNFSESICGVSLSDTSWQLSSDLVPSTRYYWMVAAIMNPSDPNSPAAYSEVWTFTTAPAPIANYSLSVRVNLSAGGSVSPNSGNYNAGTKVTLIATPRSGYRFVSWSVDASGTSPTVTIVMDSDKSVVANFEEIPPQRITLNMGGAVYGFSTYKIEFSCYLEAGEEVTGFVEWERDYTWGWQFNVYDPYHNRVPDASWEGHSRRHPFNFIASCDGEYRIEMVNLGDCISQDGVMEIRPPSWSQTEY